MSAPEAAWQPPDPPEPHSPPASPSEARTDPDLEATVPDPIRISTTQKATGARLSAPQPETVPGEHRATHGPSEARTAPRDAHCGEECSEGHTYADRCVARGEFTDEQAQAMLAAVSRAARAARLTSRDDYELAPQQADNDSGLEPYYTAIEDRVYQLRERTCQWDESDGTTQEIARQAAIAAKAAAVEEWNPVCGHIAMGHQEVIDRLRGHIAEVHQLHKLTPVDGARLECSCGNSLPCPTREAIKAPEDRAERPTP